MRVIETIKRQAEWPEDLYPDNEELRARVDRYRCSDFFWVKAERGNILLYQWTYCEGDKRQFHLHYGKHHVEPFCAFCGKVWSTEDEE